MDYQVLRAVAPGYPLLVLEQQDEWSQVVDFRKRQGWVASKLLSENNSVILKIGRGNLRSGPNLNDEVITQLSYGMVLQIEEAREDWLKVIKSDGIAGWVHKWSVWP
jgi:SH3-like domain-containing protein